MGAFLDLRLFQVEERKREREGDLIYKGVWNQPPNNAQFLALVARKDFPRWCFGNKVTQDITEHHNAQSIRQSMVTQSKAGEHKANGRNAVI